MAEVPPELMVANTALLMIDFQRDFCEPGGYVDRQAGVEWAQAILPAAERLLKAARGTGLLVVHTREGYASDLSDCSAQRQLRSQSAGAAIGSPGPLGRLLVRGEAGHAIVDRLAPLSSELVIDKTTYGAFHGTQLASLLANRDIVHLLFAGVTADVCVHSTLREATDHGYFCHYVADAISTFDPALRQACERMVGVEGGVWGRLTDVSSAIAALTGAPTIRTEP